MKAVDDAIRKSYVEFNLSTASATADDILCDPGVEDAFWSYVRSHYPVTQTMPRPALNRRLLALRKRGEDKGGLPREFRSN
jgi:hypothetical protein